jgi:hypothetical protein
MVGPGASGAGSGVVIGVVLVLLGQQLGYIDLGSYSPGLLYFIAFVVVNAIVFGIIGAAIGRRYLRKHRPVVSEWKPGTTTSQTSATGKE